MIDGIKTADEVLKEEGLMQKLTDAEIAKLTDAVMRELEKRES